MASSNLSIRLFIVLVVLGILLSECFYNVDARGARGGFRSSRRSSFRSTRRSTRRAVRPAVSPNQPLPVTTFRSNVIKSQVKTVPKTFVGAAVAGVVVYSLLRSPLHSERYSPYHGSYVVIPKKRALRIKEEEYKVENADGTSCTTGNLTRDDTQNVLNVTTKVSYEVEAGKFGIPPIPQQEYSGLETSKVTVSSEALDNYIVTIETRTQFNESVVDGSSENCTVVTTKTKAYLLTMYDTNPNSSAFRNAVNLVVILVSIIVCTRLN